MSRALALALSILAAPALADECAAFHAALGVETATSEAYDAFDARHPALDPRDRSPKAMARWSVRESLLGAVIDATHAVGSASKVLRGSIEDRYMAEVVDAIAAINQAQIEAFRALLRMEMRHREFEAFAEIEGNIEQIGVTADTGLREALKAACRLGLIATE